MRISCEFCGAEYEVDESRIPADGLPIKCARCLAVFVAKAPAVAPTIADTAAWSGGAAQPPASQQPWSAEGAGWGDPNQASPEWGTASTPGWAAPPNPWDLPAPASPQQPPPHPAGWESSGDPFTGAGSSAWISPPPSAPNVPGLPSLDPELERMLAEDPALRAAALEASAPGDFDEATRLSPSPWMAPPAAGAPSPNLLPEVIPHAPATRPSSVSAFGGSAAPAGAMGGGGAAGGAAGLDYFDLFGGDAERARAAAVDSIQYVVRRADGALLGQYDQVTVRAHLQIGKLTRGDEASTDGGLSWRPLATFAEFSDLTIVAPAPGQGGASDLARVEQMPARVQTQLAGGFGGSPQVAGQGFIDGQRGGMPSAGSVQGGLTTGGGQSPAVDYLYAGGMAAVGGGALGASPNAGSLDGAPSSGLAGMPRSDLFGGEPAGRSDLADTGARAEPAAAKGAPTAERPSWLAPAVNTAEGRASLEKRQSQRRRRIVLIASMGALVAAALAFFLLWDPAFEGEDAIKKKIALDPATVSRYRAQSRTLMHVGTYRAYAEARSKLLSVVRNEPNDATSKGLYLQAMLYLIRDYGQTAVLKEAEKVRRDLAKAGDNSVEFRKAKISFALLKKDYVDATRNLDLLLAANPDDKEARFLQGLAFTTPKDAVQAIKVFDKLLSQDPKSAKFLRAKAEALMLTQRDAGIAVLRELLTIAPSNAGGALRLAEIYFQMGRREDGRRIFAWLVDPRTPARREASPDEIARAHAYLGQLAVDERDFETARKYLLEALKLASSDDERVRALVSLGEVLIELRDYRGAIAHLDSALQKMPSSPDVLSRLATALARDGQSKRARATAANGMRALLDRKLEQLAPQQQADHWGQVARMRTASAVVNELDEIPRYGEAIDDYRAAIDASSKAPAELGPRLALAARVYLGSLLRRQKNLTGAAAELQEAVKLDDKSPVVHNGLGEVQRDQHMPDRAEASFRRALQLDGRFQDARFNLATLLSGLGRTKEALELMEQIQKIDEKYPGLNLAMAVAYQRQKRMKEAIDAFERAIKANPEDARVYLSIGKAYFEFGGEESFKKARDYLDKAIEKNRQLNEAYYWRGRSLMELGKPEIALDDYKTATEREPDNGRYRIHYGAAFEKMGSYRDALFQYTRAVEELRKQRNEIDLALALYRRGRLRLDRDEVPAAQADLEEALKYSPRNVDVLVLLGDSLAQSGAHGKAVVRYRTAAESGRRLKGLWYKLGRSLLETNQRGEAMRAMQNAANEDPSDCYPHYYIGYLYKDQKQESAAVRSLRRFLSLCQKPPEAKDVLRDIADMEARTGRHE